MNSIQEGVVLNPFGFISKITSSWIFLKLTDFLSLVFYFLLGYRFWNEIKELLYIYSLKSKAVWNTTILSWSLNETLRSHL